jgi:hypothetical protein
MVMGTLPLAMTGEMPYSDIWPSIPPVMFMTILVRVSIYRSMRVEKISSLSEFLMSFWWMVACICWSVAFSKSRSSGAKAFGMVLMAVSPFRRFGLFRLYRLATGQYSGGKENIMKKIFKPFVVIVLFVIFGGKRILPLRSGGKWII